MRFGVTGNIACGKSFVGDVLSFLGYAVIDSDLIVHELLKTKNPVTLNIISLCTPREIISSSLSLDSFIDREKLAKIFFSDEVLKTKIEKLVHPVVQEKISNFFSDKEKAGLVHSFALVPLLFEANLRENYDKVIFVRCHPEIQLERLLSRNPKLTKEEALLRINSQMKQSEKEKLSDFTIDNSGNKESTKSQILSLIKTFS